MRIGGGCKKVGCVKLELFLSTQAHLIELTCKSIDTRLNKMWLLLLLLLIIRFEIRRLLQGLAEVGVLVTWSWCLSLLILELIFRSETWGEELAAGRLGLKSGSDISGIGSAFGGTVVGLGLAGRILTPLVVRLGRGWRGGAGRRRRRLLVGNGGLPLGVSGRGFCGRIQRYRGGERSVTDR